MSERGELGRREKVARLFKSRARATNPYLILIQLLRQVLYDRRHTASGKMNGVATLGNV